MQQLLRRSSSSEAMPQSDEITALRCEARVLLRGGQAPRAAAQHHRAMSALGLWRSALCLHGRLIET
ncbi:hypothetical protein CKO42_25315 [Lamprobacter modestohalophilus]|uniref:Uncharacterized protein n=1 Tax=Lamprobacter modestohalophilus TaxID=1064514 RepID=A0A9X0WDY8_9GAMM|nr:hypothetical protein [Lamprobacter modestohalophilus]